MGYIGKRTQENVEKFGRTIEIVKRPKKWFWVPENTIDINVFLKERGIGITSGFKVLPRRWVVERTDIRLDWPI